MQLRGNWNYPTAVRFGAGRVNELPSLCAELNIKKPLIITDPGLAKLPVIETVVQIFKDADMSAMVWSDLSPNPVGRDVDAGVVAFKAGGHDGIIAVGGGSALDVGKAVGLMVGQNRPLWDFEDVGDNYLRVNVAAMAPVIAVPTTSGTGSEVGRASVIIEESEHRKVIIFHAAMLPPRVLADPELTAGLPPHLTAATGVDALVHNLEAYCSPFYHPLAQGVGLQGMKMVKDWLPIAYHDGSNIEARAHMLVASIAGATAFQKGLGGVHALAHPIGAVYNTHHGLTNAVLLPYVLQRNRSGIEQHLTDAARYLDIANPSFDAFLQWALDLRAELKIPHTLAEIGVNAERADEIGTMAKADASDGGNPIELSPTDYAQIMRDAVAGVL